MEPADQITVQSQLHQALALHQQGALDEAARLYRKVLEHDSTQFDALHLLGVIAAQNQDFAEAVALIRRALATNPNHPGAHYNLGYALEDLRQYEAALASYDKTIALAPGNVVAHNNRGTALSGLRRHEAAIASFEAAINLDPTYVDAVYNRSVAQAELGDLAGARVSLERALTLQPDYPFLMGGLVFTKLRLFAWDNIATEMAEVTQRLARGEAATAPWPALSITGSPALQRKAAELWSSVKHPTIAPRPPVNGSERRIRVGYLSPDFRVHPVAILSAGLFEHHDRSRFEVFAFSFGPHTDDAMRKRLETAFEHFIDVRDMADRDVAALARERGIDIAVDLAGYSADSRAGIFAARAAPSQVSYLGFPATMGAEFMDYIVADPVVIPPQARAFYREKVISLPCFQVNDNTREIAARDISRAQLGLPSAGVIFCCFNNASKITPEMFARWARILNAVPDSVLWLSAQGAAAENLRRAAQSHGLGAERLVFAGYLPAAEHLARYRAADLFLDTLPYNAHTTASDALWAGLPVLTCAGESYAGRVAASLLTTLGLTELITESGEDYENLAIALARDGLRLGALRKKLAAQREASGLFDTAGFARRLEEAYLRIWRRAREGHPPADITV